MMKNILPLLSFLFFSVFLSAQDTKATDGDCVILIGGKQVRRGGEISAKDLSSLCLMNAHELKTDRILSPSAFKWSISGKGVVSKGEYPSESSCSRLKEIAEKAVIGDVVFIDEIKYRGVTGLCNAQFVLKIGKEEKNKVKSYRRITR